MDEIINKLGRDIKRKEFRVWITENGDKLRGVLGEELYSQMKRYCRKNAKV